MRAETTELRTVTAVSSVPVSEIRTSVPRPGERRRGPRAARGNLEQLSSLGAFHRRLEGYDNLTADEQNELVARYQASQDLQRQIDEGELVGLEARLARRSVRAGEEAFEAVVGSVWKLTQTICREQAEGRYGKQGAQEHLPDLIAEANVAVCEAVRSFDPDRTPTFAMYVARAVRDRVRTALGQEGAVKVPPAWSRIKRIATVRYPELVAELGRVPSVEEIQADLLAVCLEWAEAKLTPEELTLGDTGRHEAKMRRLKKQGMLGAIARYEQVMATTATGPSLDAPVGEDGSASYGDTVGLPAGDDSYLDSAEHANLQDLLAAALVDLDPRERHIVGLRYGFADGEQWTYKAISELYDITSERIRQIERAVLRKLGSGTNADALAAFLPNHDPI